MVLPHRIPHSIQGLKPDGAEFLLVFDDGNFSEYETVLLTDWMAHTPKDVLAQNFGVTGQSLKKLVSKEKFIFQAAVPGPLEADRKATAGTLGLSPIDFGFRASKMPVIKRIKSGEVRIVDSTKFKISTTVAAAIVTCPPQRHPRTPLAPERRRMAILHGRQRSHETSSPPAAAPAPWTSRPAT